MTLGFYGKTPQQSKIILCPWENENITFVGDATPVHRELLDKYNINEDILIQSASDLIDYALKNNLEAKKPEEVTPVYLRKAQPER